MKLTTHPHRSDILTITADELQRIANGEELHVSALYVRLEPEPKPDVVFYGRILLPYFDAQPRVNGLGLLQGDLDNLAFTFDGTTGELKSVEML